MLFVIYNTFHNIGLDFLGVFNFDWKNVLNVISKNALNNPSCLKHTFVIYFQFNKDLLYNWVRLVSWLYHWFLFCIFLFVYYICHVSSPILLLYPLSEIHICICIISCPSDNNSFTFLYHWLRIFILFIFIFYLRTHMTLLLIHEINCV